MIQAVCILMILYFAVRVGKYERKVNEFQSRLENCEKALRSIHENNVFKDTSKNIEESLSDKVS